MYIFVVVVSGSQLKPRPWNPCYRGYERPHFLLSEASNANRVSECLS